MLSLRFAPAVLTRWWEGDRLSHTNKHVVVCATKGPRPRFPRVWKTKRKVGTLSKSIKLVQSIKELSNVKEEVYGALDSFIAWELDFPLITVKKALKTLEDQKEWKRVIQVTKWMLSKGQGRTMGSYYMLLNALAEDGRLEEVEELWTKLFSEKMDSMPRIFFEKMVSVYYHREMHDHMFERFGDMEELGIKPTVKIVKMMGDVLQKLGMLDKYQKLNKKYPPPKWVYKYVNGRRIKIKATNAAVNSSDKKLLNEYNSMVNNDSIKETESVESEGDDSIDHDLHQAADATDLVNEYNAMVNNDSIEETESAESEGDDSIDHDLHQAADATDTSVW